MKLTRFGQSCVLLETKGKRILVDPGSYHYDDSLVDNEWIGISLILITHKHGDHCNVEAINKIIARDNSELYTTQEVAKTYSELSPKIIKQGDNININSIKIEVVNAVHGYIPTLKGGKEALEGVGYIVDDGEKRAYFTGDTICFANDYKCDVIFVPICNHGLVMSPFEAGLFAKETGAELVVPYHYESPNYPGDLDKTKKEFDKQGLNYKILERGESVEV